MTDAERPILDGAGAPIEVAGSGPAASERPAGVTLSAGSRVVPAWELTPEEARALSPEAMWQAAAAMGAMHGVQAGQDLRRHFRNLLARAYADLALERVEEDVLKPLGLKKRIAGNKKGFRYAFRKAVEPVVLSVLSAAGFPSGPDSGTRSPAATIGDAIAPPPAAPADGRADPAPPTVAALLARSDLLSGQDFAAHLGITRQRLNEWRQEGRVLAIQGAKRGFRYPLRQVGGDGRILPGIPAVLAAVGDPLRAYRFLVTPLPDLAGAAPIDLLRAGEAGRACDLARAAMGAWSSAS